MNWNPINYEITENEDFQTVKRRAIADFQHYLKLLDDGTQESRDKVIRSFIFSKLFGEELGNDEELKNLRKEIRSRLNNGHS